MTRQKTTTMNNRFTEEELNLFKAFRKSPIFFIEKVWKLKPQPLKEEYKIKMQVILLLKHDQWQEAISNISVDWFMPFQKGKHITWQQWVLLLCVEKAIRGEASTKITVSSGHGVGKSSSISWIILWFLFVNYNAQVPCTAPTADQMYDVLWKELSSWISRMPETIKSQYEWGKDHIRMIESPNTWFARAKTASKENPEALAGVHADHVLTIADEASGVPEPIFNTAEGAWTSGNILVILISNPTRSEGYFYDTHHKLKDKWQRLQFSSIDSPVVDDKYEGNIAERHGRDSTEYGIRVLGKFPDEGVMDSSGYISLLSEKEVNVRPKGHAIRFLGRKILGVDPSGEGDDTTSFYIRDRVKAMKLYEEKISSSLGIAEKIVTFAEEYDIAPEDIVVDSFGVGADVGKEVAIITKGEMNITTVNVGDLCDDEDEQDLYINKRAEMFYKLKQWFTKGGELVEDKGTLDEIFTIKYKRNTKGKIQIMPKIEMKNKYGYKSPNNMDAFALTFLRDIPSSNQKERDRAQQAMYEDDFDPFSVI